MVGVVVGVFVADAVAEFFVAAVVGVLEMDRNCGFCAFDGVHGCKDGVDCGVAFGSAGHVGDCLGEDDLGFGHSDSLYCLGCCNGYAEGLRVCISDVFGGQDHNPAGDEFNVFSGVEHFGQVVYGCIGIRASHTFDESGDDVVVVVSVFVIAYDPFLDALGCHIKGDMDESVLTSGSGQDAKLNGVEGISGISPGHVCKEVQSISIYLGFVVSHSFCLIIDCTKDELFDFGNLKGFQFKDDGTGDQSGIDFKIRIFSCSADENNSSVFHERKEIVLLAFIKAVDLIDEEDGFFSVHAQILLCFFYYGFHIFFSCYSGIDLSKFCACGVGNNLCQSGFSCSWRTIEDNRGQLVSFDSSV